MNDNPLDLLLASVIILFILSTITEKFTQMVRSYPGQFRVLGFGFCLLFYIPIFRGIFFEPFLEIVSGIILLVFNTFLLIIIIANTINPQQANNAWKRLLVQNLSVLQNVKKDKTGVPGDVKEREVTALSFMLGLIVAFLFDANLFRYFNTGMSQAPRSGSPIAAGHFYALDPEFFKFDLIAAIGFVLTAFFLAFGSKFFHDLLDNLLLVKNLKRKLNEKADWEFNNMAAFEQYIATQEEALFNTFLEQQLSQPGLFFESDYAHHLVRVYITQPGMVVPDRLFYKTSLGKVKEIRVEKVLREPIAPTPQ
jgi:hypothetical protein